MAGSAARPMPDDNAGFGWVLGMGKMRPPTAGVNEKSGPTLDAPGAGRAILRQGAAGGGVGGVDHHEVLVADVLHLDAD